MCNLTGLELRLGCAVVAFRCLPKLAIKLLESGQMLFSNWLKSLSTNRQLARRIKRSGGTSFGRMMSLDHRAESLETRQVLTVPVFTSPSMVDAAENQTAVVTVAANDAASYSITGGDDSALFDIDGMTGELTFLVAPNFEVPGDLDGDNEYLVEVTADDGGGDTEIQMITVTVTNVLETPPVITSGSGDVAFVTFDENQTFIHKWQASDADPGDKVAFSLTGKIDDALFTIDPSTGELSFKAAPNFEAPADAGANNQYQLQITVTDLDGLTDTQSVTITVADVNEAPVITSGSGPTDSVSHPENFSSVVAVTADDEDAGDKLTYSLSGGADQGNFSIDPTSGLLSFVPAPNFEVPTDADTDNKYEVQVTVTDSKGLTDVQDITVTVTNTLENAPTITSDGGGDSASVSAAENQTVATTVSASDVDAGDKQAYSVSGGADAALFDIDSKTGAVTFKAAPNFEAPGDADTDNKYEVQVTVTDLDGQTDVQDITVTVTNVIETAPEITSDGGIATASVNAAENQTAVTTVTASDVDIADAQAYSISGGADAAKFSIDPVTGVLTFKASPNFEMPGDADTNNKYEVQVTVTDLDGLTDVQDITVTVTDVNEAPTITSDGAGLTASKSVAENQTAVTTVTASDVDAGDKQAFSITGGADAGFFDIDPVSGVLTFKVAPNFEVPGDADTNNKYEVQVTVTDLGSLTDVQDITVTVTDVNEAPEITSDGGAATAAVSAAENQTAVTTVTATDVDAGDKQTFSISGGADSSKFSIDPTTGVLTFKAAPNFEVPADADTNNKYEVQVTVTDTGLLTDVQDITVTVTDVNEAPTITSDGGAATASVSAAENQTAATTVTASDVDAGDKVSFSITGGADAGKFDIDPTSGALTFKAAPNFEIPTDADTDNKYEVQVTATDLGSLTDVQDITVTVTDVNEAPTITSDGAGPTASVPAAENQTAVTTVTASDVDAGDKVSFSITGGADAGEFDIDPSTGVLTFKAAPNFEAPGDADTDNKYEVQVTATDLATLTDVQDITVTVTDADDAPVITSDGGKATASVSAAENQTAVTTVTASDEDAGDKQVFSITGGGDAGLFDIDSTTGVLTFKAAPNFEAPGDADTDNKYEVQVTATDLGSLTDVQDITVTVTDEPEVAATIDGKGNFTLADDLGVNNTFLFSLSGDGMTLFITDKSGNPMDVSGIPGATGSGTNSVSIPYALITGSLAVEGGQGDDTLSLDFTNGVLIPAGGLVFNGGMGGKDTLALLNVSTQFTSETFNYTNPSDGSIDFGGMTPRSLTYSGLEPITNTGTPADITFNLPATGNPDAQLTDLGGGKARLSGTTFELTDFDVPAAGGSITINLGAGNDDLTIASLALNATTSSTIDGQAGTDAVHFNATGGLTNVEDLTVSAETINQATAITAAGISTFTTKNALTLTLAANDFDTINATSEAGVAVVDANDLTVDEVTAVGVSISADDALTMTGKVDGGTDPVSISGNLDGAGADALTMQAGSSIVTTNESATAVSLTNNTLGGGTGTLTLTSVSAGTASGIVSVSAHDGAITDGNAATNNITGFGAVLTATAGVGSSADPIETTVSRLEGAGAAGGFFVTDSDGLSIGGIGITVGVSTTTGDLAVRANGSLTVEEDVAASGATGSVLLKANETAGVDNLLVNAGVAVSSNASSVTLQAGDGITLAATSVISAGTTISIDGDSGDSDAGGSTINVASQLLAPGGTTISGGNDSDSFIITYPDLPDTNSGIVTIADAGGASDLVTVAGSAAPDTLYFTSKETPASATTDQVTRGDATSEPIIVPAGIEGLTLLGFDGNDFFHVEPSQLFPVTVNGGNPFFGGMGVPPGDVLDIDTFGNTFSFDCDVFQVNGGMPAYFPIHVRNIESLPVQPISPTPVQKYDFNYPNAAAMNGQTATQTGFTGLLPTMLYSPGSYGWTQAVTGARNVPALTGPLADLINDGATFAGLTNRTFKADVANGWVMATVTFGSSQEALNGIRISNGDDNGILADGLGTALGEWSHKTVFVNVLDGTLDLKFEDMTGNNRRVTVAGISIAPLNLISMGFNADPGTLDADGVTVDSFTLADAPANSLVTVTTTLGTLVGTDASSIFQGFQVLTNGAGQATVQLRRPSAAGEACISFATPGDARLGCSSIEYVRLDAYKFDFNSPVSPTFDPISPMNLDGYRGVTNQDVYSVDKGYGWLSPVQAFDGGTFVAPNADLINDGNRGTTTSTFRVDLDNGTYTVHLYMGDRADHQSISVMANGATVVNQQAIPRATIFETTFDITVGTGELDLTFLQNDSPFFDGHWIINGIEIQPSAMMVNTITPINVGDVFADGSTITAINATSTLMAGAQVTVSSSLGTITTPDANGMLPGVQVVVGMGGAITFNLQSPAMPGVPTVSFVATDGSATATENDPAFLNFIPLPMPIPDRHFDFNRGFDDATMTPTAPGYISVRPNQNTPLVTGYGWVTAPNSFDSRNQLPPETPVELYRDGASGPSNTSATFQFQADPGVDYDVSVIVGRFALELDQVQVTVEGAGAQIAPPSAQFSFFTTLNFNDATDLNNDGLISVTFADLGGAKATGWAAVGVDVVVSPLLAAEVGSGGPEISAADLETVVNVATSIIGANQLPGVSVVLANLSGNLLGMTAGNTIYIDADAAGMGWSTDLSNVEAGRYDLLSAIAHELGHVLGRAHDDAGTMQPVLGLGERHLDDAFTAELADLLAGL